MNNTPQLQLNETDKIFALILQGGLGSRVLQTSFIRSLIRKRKEANLDCPILVIDNSLIGNMVSAAMQNQNIHGIQIPEPPNSFPHHPGIMKLADGTSEHPVWIDSWRDNFKNFNTGGSLYNLLNNNWERAYSIEYGFSTTKKINLCKLKNEKNSFIAYHFAKTMDLSYDGGRPMLKRTIHSKELENFTNGLSKPFVLIHLGCDTNTNDYMSSLNYRFYKSWSLVRWTELIQKLGHKYTFINVYAHQYNPEIPGAISLKVDNLNAILQLAEHKHFKFFIATDNFMHHLLASIQVPGIVLWMGGGSPFVWGWRKDQGVNHFHVFNIHSCDNIFCYRPSLFDIDASGKQWVCDKGFNCGKSISVDQVLREVKKVEEYIETNKN